MAPPPPCFGGADAGVAGGFVGVLAGAGFADAGDFVVGVLAGFAALAAAACNGVEK